MPALDGMPPPLHHRLPHIFQHDCAEPWQPTRAPAGHRVGQRGGWGWVGVLDGQHVWTARMDSMFTQPRPLKWSNEAWMEVAACQDSGMHRITASTLAPALPGCRYLLPHDLEDTQQQPGTSRGPGPAAATAAGAAGDPSGDQPSSSAAAAATAQAPAAGAGASSPTSSDGSDASSFGGLSEGSMTLLVMEYCSLGNLHKAITAGRFHDTQRRPNLVRAAGAAPVWRSGLASGCCCRACMLRRPPQLGHVFLVLPLGRLSPSRPPRCPCGRTGHAALHWM